MNKQMLIRYFAKTAAQSARFATAFLSACCFATITTGCSQITPMPATSTTTAAVAAGNITGNWQASTTAMSGPGLGTLSGSIDQSGGVTASGQFTTGVLHSSSACFFSSPSIPLQGFVDSATVTLNSFAVNQQYLVLTATLNASGLLQTGVYAVHGGCGDGGNGTFTATRYSAFTGTYSGSVGIQGSSARSISLTTVQANGGDGQGNFDLVGVATFTGFSCFTHGTIQSGSVISGSSFNLLLATDDTQGGQLAVTGTIDAAAQQVTITAYTVNGGACNAQTGAGILSS